MISGVPTGQAVAASTHMRAFGRLFGALIAVFTMLAGTASAVTVDQIVALSKAGVSEAVILALIDRDNTILTIAPEQLVALKRDGLSEPVILAMLKSGRQEA